MTVMEEERSYSLMERLLFYSLPVLFTLLLSGVLLTVFGYNVVDELLRLGNKVPVVSALLPDPEPAASGYRAAETQASAEEQADELLKAAEERLQHQETEIAALRAEVSEKEAQVAELAAALEAVQTQAAEEAASAEAYAESIRSVARVYAGMKASRAAPVMQNLTLSERVLVLREMTEEERVAVLERMDPAVAAETSILLKDAVPVKDLQIAALQERLALYDRSENGQSLSVQELGRTFAQMTPNLAAEVLLAMERQLTVDILRSMDEASRAAIMNALAEEDSERTAQITASLG